MKPLFTLQFVPGNSLGDAKKLLSYQAFEFAERLLVKNPLNFFSPCGITFLENQLATFFEEGPRELRNSPPQFFLALQVSQSREFTAREFQSRADPLVDVSASRRRRRLLPSQQLRDVGFGDLSGGSEIFLLEAKFL
ncbi:MAG TPA: hypothetical protein VN428_26400 [Bryobacteraceae bacterium]|nr:hypothetical protein [Bryobacteraceae bacterium]